MTKDLSPEEALAEIKRLRLLLKENKTSKLGEIKSILKFRGFSLTGNTNLYCRTYPSPLNRFVLNAVILYDKDKYSIFLNTVYPSHSGGSLTTVYSKKIDGDDLEKELDVLLSKEPEKYKCVVGVTAPSLDIAKTLMKTIMGISKDDIEFLDEQKIQEEIPISRE